MSETKPCTICRKPFPRRSWHRDEDWREQQTCGNRNCVAVLAASKRGDDPTPEQIAERCAAERAQWSDREHWKRLGYRGGRPAVELRTVKVAEMRGGS